MVLLISSSMLVWGARELALDLGVSELVVGVTVVALGTSLPELAASLTAVLKGEQEICLGNVVGSNLYNILAVTGVAGVVRPLTIEGEVLTRDFPVMLAMTALLCFSAYALKGVTRTMGGVFLVAYVAYQAMVVWGAIR